jgi:hypothetical protein
LRPTETSASIFHTSDLLRSRPHRTHTLPQELRTAKGEGVGGPRKVSAGPCWGGIGWTQEKDKIVTRRKGDNTGVQGHKFLAELADGCALLNVSLVFRLEISILVLSFVCCDVWKRGEGEVVAVAVADVGGIVVAVVDVGGIVAAVVVDDGVVVFVAR